MLTLANVDVHYGPLQALHDVSLEVRDGEIVAILGANGAGKSTILKTISGVVPTTRGNIHFNDTAIASADPSQIVRLGIVHCPEGRHVFPDFTVEENLLIGAYVHRGAAGFEDVFALFPILGERLRQPAGTLSGGEQQMLAIGRALMGRPRLLLLDEPSLGLAPVIVERIFEVIAQLRSRGTSIVLVEQNAALGLEFADRAYVLSHGRIRFSGPASEPETARVAQETYLG